MSDKPITLSPLFGIRKPYWGPWGKWEYRENVSLMHASGYDVDIELCTNVSMCIAVILHVSQRGAFTPADVGDFIRALDEVLWLQRYRDGGSVDVADVIAARKRV